MFFSILLASVMCLQFSMQEEDILVLMASVICIHFNQLVNNCVT